MTIEFDQEPVGCWIADITTLPGVMAYGTSRSDAKAKCWSSLKGYSQT